MIAPKKVLLLHHDPASIEGVAQALEQLGHKVCFHAVLRGVVDRVVTEAPDLVLVELERPDASGRDIAALIRRDRRCQEIPVALFSTNEEEGYSSIAALGSQGLVHGGRGPKEIALAVDALLARRKPLLPVNEESRLAYLRSLRVLDTPPDPIFDEIVAAASALAGVPIALVSLIDAERQWLKARVGLDVTETPRDVAFCAHAISGTQIFEVHDAVEDPRFANNPLVTMNPKIRFYAGAPLQGSGGLSLGTLCVVDRVPRALTDNQREALVHLSRVVVLLLEKQRPLLVSS